MGSCHQEYSAQQLRRPALRWDASQAPQLQQHAPRSLWCWRSTPLLGSLSHGHGPTLLSSPAHSHVSMQPARQPATGVQGILRLQGALCAPLKASACASLQRPCLGPLDTPAGSAVSHREPVSQMLGLAWLGVCSKASAAAARAVVPVSSVVLKPAALLESRQRRSLAQVCWSLRVQCSACQRPTPVECSRDLQQASACHCLADVQLPSCELAGYSYIAGAHHCSVTGRLVCRLDCLCRRRLLAT